MSPLSPVEWTWLVTILLGLTVLLYLQPSCGDAACTATHAKHTVAQRSVNASRNHDAFHGPTAPDPLCPSCVIRKRDDDTPS